MHAQGSMQRTSTISSLVAYAWSPGCGPSVSWHMMGR